MILANEKALLAFGDVIKRINTSTPRLQQLTEEIAGLKLANGASGREIAAAGQLVTLTQRVGRSATQMVAGTEANQQLALTLASQVILALLQRQPVLPVPFSYWPSLNGRMTSSGRSLCRHSTSPPSPSQKLEARPQV